MNFPGETFEKQTFNKITLIGDQRELEKVKHKLYTGIHLETTQSVTPYAPFLFRVDSFINVEYFF